MQLLYYHTLSLYCIAIYPQIVLYIQSRMFFFIISCNIFHSVSFTQLHLIFVFQCFPGCLTIQIRTTLCILIVLLIYAVAQACVVSGKDESGYCMSSTKNDPPYLQNSEKRVNACSSCFAEDVLGCWTVLLRCFIVTVLIFLDFGSLLL